MAKKCLLFLALGTVLFGCSKSQDDEPIPEPRGAAEPLIVNVSGEPVEAPATKEPYPSSIRSSFVESCSNEAAEGLGAELAETICTCSLDAIEKKYSLGEFVELSEKMSGGGLPDELQKVVMGCVEQVTAGSVSKEDEEDATPRAYKRYPEAAREDYLSNCVKSAVDDGTKEIRAKAYCTCTLKAFETKYSITQFFGLLAKVESDMPDEFMTVVQGCLMKLTDDEPSIAKASGGSRFPDNLRNPFLEACINSSKGQLGEKTATRICECTLRKVENHYSLEDFIKIAAKMDGGELPSDLEAMVVSCVSEFVKQ